jgi:HlyD family secretion protein
MKKLLFVTLLMLLLSVLLTGWLSYSDMLDAQVDQIALRTAKVERRDLVVGLDAKGTLEPEEVVDVGAQVGGRIKELGDDPRATIDPVFAGKHVDVGTTVEKGTVLASIDEAVYLAQRNQAQAALARSKADVVQFQAQFAQAEAEWHRAQRLRSLKIKGVKATDLLNRTKSPARSTALEGEIIERSQVQIRAISDAEFIQAKSNYEVAKANIDVGKAVVAHQQSALDLAEMNLAYTVIQSPVQGTIIDRRVNIGQMVMASLNGPGLFLIAKDLRRMQVWALVDETDIGELKSGTPVSFKVDAFPRDVYRGAVAQVRPNAKKTQNAVTYTVVIETDNSNLKLLPSLTADVRFELSRREQVLSVPNAALSCTPRTALIAASTVSMMRMEADAALLPNAAAKNYDEATIWTRKGSRHVSPMKVKVGVSDGTRTEVEGPGLAEGLEVVLGESP